MNGESFEEKMCHQFSGPLLFHYVWWVLREAQKRQIHTLYFLARDGYLLYRMAKLFCKRYSLPIVCKYFFCSRASLRMPTYWLIGEEAYTLLFANGYRVSLNSLLQRAECTEEEKNMVCRACRLEKLDRQTLLSKVQLGELKDLLQNNSVFRKLIEKKSHQSYKAAVKYLQQEGLFFQENVALVDSGWGGSIQRSIRQLLTSAGYCGRVTGFYFGMFEKPKSTEDGEYLTWFFSAEGKAFRKIPFNPNLFEILLSAPHGMTIRYKQENGKAFPVFLKNQMPETELEKVKSNVRLVLDYTSAQLRNVSFDRFPKKIIQKNAEKLIWRYMAHPTRQEAEYYGNLLFCDDISDGYQMKLADVSQQIKLNSYSIFPRIIRKVFHCPSSRVGCDLFWPYGVIAFLPKWKQSWYRWNIFVWEWIRYIKKM